MKKRILALTLIGVMGLSLAACGSPSQVSDASAEGTTFETVGLMNPWRICTEEEAKALVPNCFSAHEGASSFQWSIMEDPSKPDENNPLIQMAFDLDDMSFTAREQLAPGKDITDLSGMFYEWQNTDDITLVNWGDGQVPGKYMSYMGSEECASVCLWYDKDTGYAYSLGVTAKDLDGFDLQAVAEAISGRVQETADAAVETEEISETAAPSIDITGCDTFTQIVDKKLSAGMGYANVTLDGTDVLLVSSGTFDDLEGQKEAIDATIFMYKDGVPFEVGQVASSGTAYPLTVVDGKLFAGGNHWIGKFALTGDKLMVMEKAYVIYDENGNGTYYYESDDGGDYSGMDSAEAEKIFDSLIEEMMSTDAEIVSFSQVQ